MPDNIPISANRKNQKKQWIIFSLTAGHSDRKVSRAYEIAGRAPEIPAQQPSHCPFPTRHLEIE